MGAILACITAIQPVINAIDGTFDLRDGFQILAAGLIAGLGYYIQKKQERPDADPPADDKAKPATTAINSEVAALVRAEIAKMQKEREAARQAAKPVTQ